MAGACDWEEELGWIAIHFKAAICINSASSSDPVSINAQAIFLSLLSQNPAAVYMALPLVGGENGSFWRGNINLQSLVLSFSLKALDYVWRELQTEV